MTSRNSRPSDSASRLNDAESVADALQAALSETRQRHAKMSHHSAAWRDGRVVLINPVDLSEIKIERESA